MTPFFACVGGPGRTILFPLNQGGSASNLPGNRHAKLRRPGSVGYPRFGNLAPAGRQSDEGRPKALEVPVAMENRTRILSHLEGPAGTARLTRFWDKVDQRGDCWNWTAGIGAGGYGCFKLARGVTVTAHRLSLVVATRRDPIGLEAAHSCNNVLCCNPAHLRWATHQENQDDKRLKSPLPAPGATGGEG